MTEDNVGRILTAEEVQAIVELALSKQPMQSGESTTAVLVSVLSTVPMDRQAKMETAAACFMVIYTEAEQRQRELLQTLVACGFQKDLVNDSMAMAETSMRQLSEERKAAAQAPVDKGDLH